MQAFKAVVLWIIAGVVAPLIVAGPPVASAFADPERAIAGLRAEIARHDQLYHRDAAPEISDEDYDRLKRRLVELERQFPAAAEAAPRLAGIGDDRTGRFATHRHRERMLSLEKAYGLPELARFHHRVAKALGRDDPDYVIEPKIDGMAVSVTYEDGELIRAITRGDGVEGEDITANVRMTGAVPPTLAAVRDGDGRLFPLPDRVELRGELFVPFASFERVNAEREAAGATRFANPRNLVAGTMRQQDPSQVAHRGVQAAFFAIGACTPESVRPESQQELHAMLRQWNVPVIRDVVLARGARQLARTVAELGEQRFESTYPTDGVVVKVDSVRLQRELGAGEIAPRWAVAFKFASERAETRVRAITLQVGRTGVLTPVAELEPVALSGSVIARATLHNMDEITRRDIRVGDFVYVEKAGGVIPAVVAVNQGRRAPGSIPFRFPERCPDCATALVRRAGEAAIRCPNAACPAQLCRRIEHFASKACLNIDGLGPAMIAGLVRRGVLKGLPDIYHLTRDDLDAGRGARSADRLLGAIEASKRAELWRVLHGLGIPQVGPVAARGLAAGFGSLENLLAAAVASGRTPPAPPLAYFAEPPLRDTVLKLIAAGVRPTVTVGSGARLAGKTIVLTGALPTLTRAEASSRIQAAGATVSGSVSRKTSFVIAGAGGGAKLDRARELGIPVMDEAGLWQLLAQP